jgi:hypothetical protein
MLVETKVVFVINKQGANDMSTIATLKLSTSKKSQVMNPAAQRRNKLCKKLWEQIQLAQAHLEGKEFTTTRFRTVTDQDGLRRSIELPKRVRAWWWNGDNGKIALNVDMAQKWLRSPRAKAPLKLLHTQT